MLLRGDIPITDERQDLFSRKPLADVLVTAIREYARCASNCITIGIYGSWGEGKTSLLNIVKNRLEQIKYKDHLLIASYNPWLIKDQESMLIDFFRTIMGAGFSRRAFSYLKQYGNLISYVAGQISDRIAPLSGNTIESIIGRLICGLPDSGFSLEDFKNQISKQLVKENRHLIVFIDDLDRLNNREIHTVFRLIKQVADFDNVIYLVAMDVDRVAQALGSKDSYGRGFIDKIIQIPVPLPKLQRADIYRELKRSLISLADEFGVPNDRLDVEMVASSLIGFVKNKRDITRYFNSMLLLLPSVKNELNLNDFCRLEFLNIYNHSIYEDILYNRTALLRLHTSRVMSLMDPQVIEKKTQESFDKAIGEFREKYGEEVSSLVQALFPKREPAPIELAYERSRINHAEFFDRYFIRDYQKGSIPQAEVNALLSDISGVGTRAIVDFIDKWLNISDLERTFDALETVIVGDERDVKKRKERAKAIIIALVSSSFPDKVSANRIAQIRFVSRIVSWMHSYMCIINSDGGREYDEIEINAIFKHIFSSLDPHFCMDFLSSYNQYLSEAKMRPEVFYMLRDTIAPQTPDRSYEVILRYSRDSIQTFFVMWNRVASEDMHKTMKSWVEDESFPSELFIRRFVDAGTTFPYDLDLFVALFADEVDLFMSHLSNRLPEGSEDEYYKRILVNWKVTLQNHKLLASNTD